MIAIIDYKAGNLASVRKAFEAVGAECVITSDPSVVCAADKLVLPGVGHFSATSKITDLGLREPIKDAIGSGKPFLGICVGMQWLFSGSSEAPEISGLGIFADVCDRFPRNGLKCPHVGWNRLQLGGRSRLLKGISENSYVYFTHSYRAPVTAASTAIARYGDEFACAVEKDNVFGVQFHPEKSGPVGLKIVQNFAELPC